MKRVAGPEIASPIVAIADYDMGNRTSVSRALRAAGADPILTRDPAELGSADAIILPGVGAFPAVMERIRRYGLDKELRRARLEDKPLLGICLGHQLFFEASEEGGYTEGLGFLAGAVRPIHPGGGLINIGWREVTLARETALSEGLDGYNAFYHLHAFAAVPEDPSVVFAYSPYPVHREHAEGSEVVGAVQAGSLYGVQFHPEKSGQKPGIDMMRNFVDIARRFKDSK